MTRSGYASLRRGRYAKTGHQYHVVTATLGRLRLFEDFGAAHAAANALTSLTATQEHKLLAWVLMPDHLHCLLELGSDDLSGLVRRMKSITARGVRRRIGGEGPVWQRGYYDCALRRTDDVQQVARYILANPIRAGLVENIGDYPFWDAVWVPGFAEPLA